MTPIIGPEALAPLSRKDVVNVPGHPYCTFDFPTQDDGYTLEEAHHRLWATLWKLQGRASQDARVDRRDKLPRDIWGDKQLSDHARYIAHYTAASRIDVQSTNIPRNLTNHRERFQFFYGTFYLATYLDLLSHEDLTPDQKQFLATMQDAFRKELDVPGKDALLARKVFAQIPGFTFLGESAEAK